MTPKEKAIELVEKFQYVYPVIMTSKEGDWKQKLERMNSLQAKQCALICVDEISKGIALQTVVYPHLNNYKYWQEVKQKINKL